MLTATRVISRKALDCAGISDIYTHRNFSSILKNVSNHYNIIKTNENRASTYRKITNPKNDLFHINCDLNF